VLGAMPALHCNVRARGFHKLRRAIKASINESRTDFLAGSQPSCCTLWGRLAREARWKVCSPQQCAQLLSKGRLPVPCVQHAVGKHPLLQPASPVGQVVVLAGAG